MFTKKVTHRDMKAKRTRGSDRKPPTVVPREVDARPLSLDYFEDPTREESFSAEVVRRLKTSPFFRPERNPDGSITDRTMLTVASVVIAAAERELGFAQMVRERLTWWNSPLFQKPVMADRSDTGDAEEIPDAGEIAFFSKYLTLRNILAVVVTVTLAGWTIFNFIESKNAADIQTWKDKLAASERDNDRLRNQYEFYSKHSSDLGDELKKAQKEVTDTKVESQGIKDKAANLSKDLVAANKRVADAEMAAKEANNRAAVAEAATRQKVAANPPPAVQH